MGGGVSLSEKTKEGKTLEGAIIVQPASVDQGPFWGVVGGLTKHSHNAVL